MAESGEGSEEEQWTRAEDHGGYGPGFPSVRLDLLQRAFDALEVGLLIVSREEVCFYNAAYAQLRHLSPSAPHGRPLEEVDRRHRLQRLLQTGRLPPELPMAVERRGNRESLLPLWKGEELLGVVVVVTPAAQLAQHTKPGTRRVAQGGGDGKLSWAARYTFADIIGHSPALARAQQLALQSARGGSSVLLVGESGTGKELFAHAIHAVSARRAGPFVPVDCSAIPRELLEAELFGYDPGAFTGAVRQGKPGKFELAHGGTIFLDEIGEMPLEMQAKLLRVLQEREVSRVGGVTSIPVAFAIIAATNRDLESLVAQGRFRRDLLYRLDVIRVEVPPLRERAEDIPLLVAHYWAQKSQELGESAKLSAEALWVLEGYSWPGNVRELVNVVERLLVGVAKPVIEPEDLPAHLRLGVVGRGRHFSPFDLETVRAEAERQALERALQQAQGNRNKAAQLAGLSRASFYRKVKVYGLLTDGKASAPLREQE
ncbi:MAG: sigma 54-interacting transcriptional regulator [Nitrospinae bacterium]|nr:sigma 54-interacting transcriptional regulator [Nitrospinota bacterium]